MTLSPNPAGNYLAEDAAKCDQYVSGDAALGAHPELHASTPGGGSTTRSCAARPWGPTLAPRPSSGTARRASTGPRASGTGSARSFPPDGHGGLNTKELAPIPAISPPAPHHGLVVENRDPIRFREFLVFHGEYAYPEYLLAYKRV